MKKVNILLLATILFSLPVIAQELTAIEIIDKADKKSRGETSQGTMMMKIVRPDWERTVEMKSWSKGDDFFLIYITAPAKDTATTTLTANARKSK